MNNSISIKKLNVGLQFQDDIIPVGQLAMSDNRVYFEYDASFIKSNLEISPFKLPLEFGLHRFNHRPFEGLSGVFNDSLPDGWGRLLIDRHLRSKHILPEEISPLDRLAFVGKTGPGALVYEPELENPDKDLQNLNLDIIHQQTQDVLKGEANDVLQTLIQLNGSSAGARPKAFIGVDNTKKALTSYQTHLSEHYEHWLVKFANSTDGIDAGAIEYVYALMAKQAGLDMMPIHLFSSDNNSGYFATQRFDRIKQTRVHTHTASGLLDADFRVPSLDYENLLTLTQILTKDIREVEKMYRIAVFNVLSHNRDDHGKNFSFLMDNIGEWKLAPAYDLTFSSGPSGQQSTMVLGEGLNPTVSHLIKLGTENGLKRSTVNTIIEQTKDALNTWETLAKNHGVYNTNITFIKSRMIK